MDGTIMWDPGGPILQGPALPAAEAEDAAALRTMHPMERKLFRALRRAMPEDLPAMTLVLAMYPPHDWPVQGTTGVASGYDSRLRCVFTQINRLRTALRMRAPHWRIETTQISTGRSANRGPRYRLVRTDAA